MADGKDLTNYENCYVNIPIFILKNFWLDYGVEGFLYHVFAFGAASNQILSIEYDYIEIDKVKLKSTTVAIDPIMNSINYLIDEYEAVHRCKQNTFTKLVSKYKNWIQENGETEWMHNGRWIGVTAHNIKKMIEDKYSISEAKRERWEQMWMIYFGLKSVIGRKRYVQIAWDFILIRSMGFFNSKEYNTHFNHGESWITQLQNRKAKEKMIERLCKNFNLVYATHRPEKGEHAEVAQWSFQKGFKWVAKKGTS